MIKNNRRLFSRISALVLIAALTVSDGTVSVLASEVNNAATSEYISEEEAKDLPDNVSDNEDKTELDVKVSIEKENYVMDEAEDSDDISAEEIMDESNLPSYGGGDTFLSRPFLYEINDDGTATIVGCINNMSGALNIPSTLGGKKVTVIGDFAFSDYPAITSVTIPNTVKIIGEYAFQNCTGIKGNLIIPDSVETIGDYAFMLCSGLSGKLVIGNSVKEIGDMAFNGCTNLGKDTINGKPAEITFGSSLEIIGDNAFNDCSNIRCELKLPSSLKILDNSAFAGCGFKGKLQIPGNVEKIGHGAFMECVGLTGNITIPDSVTYLGDSSFRDCKKLSGTITIGKGVTHCDKDLFDGIPGINKVINNSDCEIYLPNLGKNFDEDVVWSVDGELFSGRMLGAKKTAYAFSGTNTTTAIFEKTSKHEVIGSYDIVLNNNMFEESSYEYNHELAKVAAAFSTLVYNTHASEIVKTFNNLGFNTGNLDLENVSLAKAHNANIYYPDETNSVISEYKTGKYAPFWITHKKIWIDNQAYTVLLVAIRGTSNTEWVDNFNPGTSMTHDGFYRSAYRIVTELNNYIGEEGIDPTKLKILVTGHSRGAAVANIVENIINAVKSSSYFPNLHDVELKDVYTYTFASPNVTTDPYRVNSIYNNVFNIINPEDFVTKVMPVAWGYGRYGKSYVLPSSSLAWIKGIEDPNYQKNYEEYKKEVVRLKNKYDYRTKYEPYKNGMEEVTSYVSSVTSSVKNVTQYYKTSLDGHFDGTYYENPKTGESFVRGSLFRLFTETLGYFMAGESDETEAYRLKAIDNMTEALNKFGRWGNVGANTCLFFFAHAFSISDFVGVLREDFNRAHEPYTYLAMMEAVSPEYLKANKYYKGIKVSCPVDVAVKDSEGNTVGEVIDNEVVKSEGSLSLDVEGESKTIFLPGDDDYTLEMTGNDEGTMDYTVIEYDPDLGEVSRVVYKDVPLTNGQQYTELVEAEKAIDELTLMDEDDQALTPLGTFSGDALGQLSISVEVIGNGKASGYERLSPGDYVMLNATPSGPNKFLGWYDKEGNLLSDKNNYGVSVMESLELEARFTENTEGIWAEEPAGQVYTGQALKPEINVYDGDKLVDKSDYAISYKNNTNVYTLAEGDTGFDPRKAPTITITSKGNYSGKDIVYFTIEKKNISDSDMTVSDIATVIQGRKEYTPVPTVTYGKKKLTVKKDYTVKYYLDSTCRKEVLPSEEGTYYAKVEGNGSYTGSVIKEFEIGAAAKVLASKLAIAKIADKLYTGEPIELEEDELIVMDGKEPLTRDVNYKAVITNNTDIGVATVKIIGIDDKYIGSKVTTFKIKGTELSKAVMQNYVAAYTYDGSEKKQTALNLIYSPRNEEASEIKIIEAEEYNGLEDDEKLQYGAVVTYSKNTDAGTATMLLTGVNYYTGSIKKTYKINQFEINKDPDDLFKISIDKESYPYSKAGVVPEPEVEFNGQPLTKGVDYTVAYANNTAVTDLSARTVKYPTVKITGKGNFKGVDATKTFLIVPKNIEESGDIIITAKDKVYADKKGNWKSTFTVYDRSKKLSSPKDYLKEVEYTYDVIPDGAKIYDGSDRSKPEIDRAEGGAVGENDIVPAGTVIRLKIKGADIMYSGTMEATYKVVAKDINSLKVVISDKQYTGNEITLTEEEFKFYVGTKPATDVTFFIDAYANNIKKGKASVTIKGTGNYGGEKVVSYNIVAKKFFWWWR